MPKIRILVVDDDEGMLTMCAEALRGLADAEVALESSSPQAAERLAKESFDLLISDIRMPELSGIELLDRAK